MNSDQLKLLQQLALLGDVTFINSTREGLINAISVMDSTALELILDDEVSYQDTTKIIFLERLNEIFNQFKETDTTLIAYEGKCFSDECPNKNTSGISFVGNNSGNYLNLIIEQNDNGCIKDIYNCHQFCTEKNVKDFMKTEFNIRIYKDEKVNFYPSSNYINIKNECISAVHELKKEKGLSGEVLITSQEIIDWINKYQPVYDSFVVPPLFFKQEDTFYWIYCDVKRIYEFLFLENEATQALIEYKNVNLNDEIEILKWLVKYEHFHYDLILLHPNTISENGIKTGREKLSNGLVTYFNINILKNCIALETILDKYYYGMLNKYTTETPAEKEIQAPFDDNFDEISSLKYHLEKRGII